MWTVGPMGMSLDAERQPMAQARKTRRMAGSAVKGGASWVEGRLVKTAFLRCWRGFCFGFGPDFWVRIGWAAPRGWVPESRCCSQFTGSPGGIAPGCPEGKTQMRAKRERWLAGGLGG
jgi:hypothetical protein